MKIGYFINQYPAVSHTFIRREILALEELGVEITRYALKPIEAGLKDASDKRELERTNFLLRAGLAHILACCLQTLATNPVATARALGLAWRVGAKSERGRMYHMIYVVEAMVLANWCKRDDIGHLHVHFGTNSATVAMLARLFSGIPFSMTVHGIEEFEKAVLLSLDEKLKHSSFAVCVSSYGRSQLMRWVPAEMWRKIMLVRCGVDQQFLESDIEPLSDTRRLVCVGRLCVHKAQTLLVAAAKKLEESGTKCEIVLVGDGELRSDVEAAIENAGLNASIKITGWASGEEVREHIAHSRALVLPSISENLPVVIMEAMALGRPVVSTYVAGIPELVKPGETGWLVPASDVDALTHALKEVLTTPIDTLSSMGAAARERVAQQHNVMNEAEKLKQLFSKALSQGTVDSGL